MYVPTKLTSNKQQSIMPHQMRGFFFSLAGKPDHRVPAVGCGGGRRISEGNAGGRWRRARARARDGSDDSYICVHGHGACTCPLI